jgi:TP901 family phage tail tape measure protein
MPEIGQIVSKKSVDEIFRLDEGFQKSSISLKAMLDILEKANTLLKSSALTTESLNKAQKQTAEISTNLTKIGGQLAKGQEKLKNIEIERNRIQEQQRRVLAKNLTVQEKSNVILQKGKLLLQQRNKEVKQNILANQALKGSYNAISISLSKNIAKFKAMSESERETSKRGKELTATIKRQDAQLKKLDGQMGRSQRHVGDYGRAIAGSAKALLGAFGLIGGVAALARVLTSSFKTVVQFEKKQSELAAVLRTNTKGIERLTKASLEYGRVTKFTASEVSTLQKELAKLGFTQSEIILSTKAVLDLAAATESDLGEAAKVTGAALRAFNLSASESERVASVLAVATTKSALAFEDYGSALSNVAPVAAAFGFSIEDTVALLGTLRDAGFEANKASVATRNILLNLADSGGVLAQKLGGSVRSFDELIPALIKLREEGISLGESLELTDKRSVAAFNRFLEGAESANKLRDGLIGVTGELDRMVEVRLDNVAGDVTLLASAWDGLVLAMGKSGFFRSIIQGATNVVKELTPITNEFEILFNKIKEGEEIIKDVGFFDFQDLSKKAQDVIKGFRVVSTEELKEVRIAFVNELKEIGFTAKTASGIWGAYLKDRIAQTKAEEDAVIASEKKKQDAIDRTAVENKAAAKKTAIENDKKNDKIARSDKKLAEEHADIIEDDFNAVEDFETKKLGVQINSNIASLEQTKKFLKEQAKSEEDDRKKKAADKKKDEDDARELEEEISLQKNELAFEAASVAGDILFAGKQAQLAEDLTLLQQEKEARLAAAEGNAEELERINKEFAVKENAIKTKQAKADKQASLTQAIINTAEAITKALPNIPLSILAAAFGALQIAKIASTPIPKFHKGTKNAPGTGFIAGDSPTSRAASELVITKGGETYLAKKDTLFVGNKFKGAEVKNSKETEAILRGDKGVSNTIVNFDTLELQKSNAKGFKDLRRTIIATQIKNNRTVSNAYKQQFL